MRKALRHWRIPFLSLALVAFAALWVAGVLITVALAPAWATKQAPSLGWAAMVSTLRDQPDAHQALVRRVLSATPRQHDLLAVILRRNDRRSRTVALALAGAVEACESEWDIVEECIAAEEFDAVLLIGAVQDDPDVAEVCQAALDRPSSYGCCRGYVDPPSWHALLPGHVAIMTTSELARLTRWLADTHPCDRGEGSEVPRFLQAQLDDPDPVVARAALSGLCWRGSPTIGDRLVALSVDDDSTSMINAWFASVRDPAAGPALAAMLAHAHRVRRLGAVLAIGRCRAVAHVPALIAALEENPSLQAPILVTLAELRDPRAITSFITALRDDDPMVRMLAARGLSGLDCDRAAAALSAAAVDDPLIASVLAHPTAR